MTDIVWDTLSTQLVTGALTNHKENLSVEVHETVVSVRTPNVQYTLTRQTSAETATPIAVTPPQAQSVVPGQDDVKIVPFYVCQPLLTPSGKEFSVILTNILEALVARPVASWMPVVMTRYFRTS